VQHEFGNRHDAITIFRRLISSQVRDSGYYGDARDWPSHEPLHAAEKKKGRVTSFFTLTLSRRFRPVAYTSAAL